MPRVSTIEMKKRKTHNSERPSAPSFSFRYASLQRKLVFLQNLFTQSNLYYLNPTNISYNPTNIWYEHTNISHELTKI